MFGINNEKNTSAVILNPERSEWVSRSHVTSVEPVVNYGVKTKRYSAKRDLYGDFAYAQPLKMTEKVLSFLRLRGASEKQKESSLILRKAKFQAIFKFVLSSASGGAGGGKYNRISAFVSMPVLLIRRSLEKFFKKNFRDDSFTFGFAKVVTLTLLLTFATTAESWADESATTAEDTTQKLLANEGDCGVGCKYKITTDATTGARSLCVYNDPNYSGAANIADNAFAGYGKDPGNNYREYHTNATFDKITIDGDFDTIGENAFWHNGASEVVFKGNVKNINYAAFEYNNLSSVNLPEGLEIINAQAFYGNKMSSVTIPDSVTSISNHAFYQTGNILISVYISDDYKSIGAYPFGTNSNLSIICRGEVKKCQSFVTKNPSMRGLSNHVIAATYENCNTANYFWNGAECVREPDVTKRKCCDSCKDMGGWCNRIRYTPAEAAKVLRDGNTNEVTITFKK